MKAAPGMPMPCAEATPDTASTAAKKLANEKVAFIVSPLQPQIPSCSPRAAGNKARSVPLVAADCKTATQITRPQGLGAICLAPRSVADPAAAVWKISG